MINQVLKAFIVCLFVLSLLASPLVLGTANAGRPQSGPGEASINSHSAQVAYGRPQSGSGEG